MIHVSQLFILCSVLILSVSKLRAEPQKWSQWKQAKIEYYQQPFSSPSITHHTYIKKGQKRVWLDLQGRYPRFSVKACGTCDLFINRGAKGAVSLWRRGTTKPDKLISGEKVVPVGDGSDLSLSLAGDVRDEKLRVFLHSLKQKSLTQKRRRFFYEYKNEFKMKGAFHWSAVKKQIKIQRSDGSVIQRDILGKIRFDIQGKPTQLDVFNFHETEDGYKEDSQTMLLFRDASSGKETYGAGRFLNVDFGKKMKSLKNGDRITLDFNFAYNPPCAVSTGFHCPLPQQILPAAVLAGEKYHSHK